jgi:hypothetical protein
MGRGSRGRPGPVSSRHGKSTVNIRSDKVTAKSGGSDEKFPFFRHFSREAGETVAATAAILQHVPTTMQLPWSSCWNLNRIWV